MFHKPWQPHKEWLPVACGEKWVMQESVQQGSPDCLHTTGKGRQMSRKPATYDRGPRAGCSASKHRVKPWRSFPHRLEKLRHNMEYKSMCLAFFFLTDIEALWEICAWLECTTIVGGHLGCFRLQLYLIIFLKHIPLLGNDVSFTFDNVGLSHENVKCSLMKCSLMTFH